MSRSFRWILTFSPSPSFNAGCLIPLPFSQERRGDNSEFKLIKPLPPGRVGGRVSDKSEKAQIGKKTELEGLFFFSKFALPHFLRRYNRWAMNRT